MKTIEVVDKLNNILKFELTMKHVELHASRKHFIEVVIKMYGKDKKFDKLVENQLDLFVDGHLDSRTFYSVCNDPYHKIRNMLICWFIDHI